MKEKTFSVTLAALPEFISEFLLLLPQQETATVVALSGDLGAGKTTFVKQVASTLGVPEVVTSPTFTILKGYETAHKEWSHLLHMDAYRIEDLEELEPLRFATLITQPKTIFFIEWAEKIPSALPADTVWVTLENTDQEDKRTVRLTGLPVNG